MSIEADDPLSGQLARFGALTFTQDCAVGGRRARLAMNSEQTVLAVDDGRAALAATFDDVDVAGDGVGRTVTIGGQQVGVGFDSDYDAQRFVRVLGVRRASPVGPASPRPSQVRAAHQRQQVPLWPGGRSPSARDRHQRWSKYALWSSTALLVIAALELVAAVIVVVVALVRGHPLQAPLSLLRTIVAIALPVCLAALTRVVVYGHEALDA